MIISHRYQFVFIHCRKTGGSAVKSLLAHCLGPGDLQIGCWGDAIDAGAKPNRRFITDLLRPRAAAQMVKKTLREPLWWADDRRWSVLNAAQKKVYKKRIGGSPAHPTATQIRNFAPTEFEHYTKFCIVRNPFDKVLSDYYWRCGLSSDKPSFLSFLEELRSDLADARERSAKFDNWPMYTIDDAVVVDRIARYEELVSSLSSIFSDLGIPVDPADLPTAKNVRGEQRSEPASWFGEKERRLVEQLYSREIAEFGYTLENVSS